MDRSGRYRSCPSHCTAVQGRNIYCVPTVCSVIVSFCPHSRRTEKGCNSVLIVHMRHKEMKWFAHGHSNKAMRLGFTSKLPIPKAQLKPVMLCWFFPPPHRPILHFSPFCSLPEEGDLYKPHHKVSMSSGWAWLVGNTAGVRREGRKKSQGISLVSLQWGHQGFAMHPDGDRFFSRWVLSTSLSPGNHFLPSSLQALGMVTAMQEVLNQGWFSPQGTFCNICRHFLLPQWGGVHWHLGGRCQRWCEASYRAQNRPAQQRTLRPGMQQFLRWETLS